MTKKLLTIFILAFVLNFVWEELHSYLYVHYQSGEITQFVLLRAAAFDAAFITVLGFFFLTIPFLQNRVWLSFVFGLLAAIGIEWYALETGRWEYKEIMPIIPFLQTGLTPTVQLGLLSYFILYIITKKSRKKKSNHCNFNDMAQIITTADLKKKIDGGAKDFYLIDALSAGSYEARHIPGAKSVPYSPNFVKEFEKTVGAAKDAEIIIYCASSTCQLSVLAADALEKAGYTNVKHYKDGLAGWQAARYEFSAEGAGKAGA